MELIHCIYCSAASDPALSTDDLRAILEQSHRNNAAIDVTGILLFEAGSFLQVLEGAPGVVDTLYRKIETDNRHHTVTKLISEPIESRSFGSWSMGYPRVSRADIESLPGLNGFFQDGRNFLDIQDGRAKTLLDAFRAGKWHL